MPNGKPGDHPFTDIVSHRLSVCGEPIDTLVRELAAAPGFAAVSERVNRIVEECDEARRRLIVGERELAALKRQLGA